MAATVQTFRTETTDLAVHGMTCGNCVRHVTEAIQHVDGVSHATVSLDPGRATVKWKRNAEPDMAAVIAAIENAGYQIFLSSAFSDIWPMFHEGEMGNTWPLHVGHSVTDATPSQRIDLVLFRGAIGPEEVELIGNRRLGPTPTLWPSDHAGVVASFNLKAGKE